MKVAVYLAVTLLLCLMTGGRALRDIQQVLVTASTDHPKWDHGTSALTVTGGGPKKASTQSPVPMGPVRWFRPLSTPRERSLATWLLVWNGIALVDAFMFTFRPEQNLNGYLIGEWGPHTMAMTRMLANCQLALVTMIALLGFTADEKTLKNIFKILILVTLGAFRAVAAGVREGTIKAPWTTGYAAVMSAPPLLFLAYFAFLF